jgi:hypothetical protein
VSTQRFFELFGDRYVDREPSPYTPFTCANAMAYLNPLLDSLPGAGINITDIWGVTVIGRHQRYGIVSYVFGSSGRAYVSALPGEPLRQWQIGDLDHVLQTFKAKRFP